jgi:hypothetical protein
MVTKRYMEVLLGITSNQTTVNTYSAPTATIFLIRHTTRLSPSQTSSISP